MGNQGAKKRLQQNEKELTNLKIGLGAINAIYALYRVWYHGDTFGRWNWVLWIIVLILQGELLDGGSDLSMKGLCEYYFDIIYITGIVQILGLFSDKAFLIMLVIPGFASYQLWVQFLGPWFFAPAEQRVVDDERKSNRREKMEKKQNKV
eukprot:gene9803-11452_t